MKFRKDDITREFAVRDGRVMTTIIVDGLQVSNPSLELFLSHGWEIVPEPDPEPAPEPKPYIPTIEELVEGKLRELYSINQEFEVQRKRESEPQAFQAYYDYVEECIAWANEQPHREGDKV